jgi:hypothetical protein
MASESARYVQNDTLCRFPGIRDWNWRLPSGGVDGGGVNQQNGNAVLDRVDAATRGAFQAGRIVPQRQRLLAGRTNQYVEKILRNHDFDILTRFGFVTTESQRHRETQQPGKELNHAGSYRFEGFSVSL